LLGDFALPTGQIVAADPFYTSEEFTQPFSLTVPTGRYRRYPVIASVVDLSPWGQVSGSLSGRRTKCPALDGSDWLLAAETMKTLRQML
jgi:hypothetical protein